jgi:eukaryotic-like serine/threonine-protein kinase
MLMGDRYEIEETLGQGGAGVVYRAFDRVLQRPVAIKTLEFSKGGPDQGVERLRREAALLGRLEHPNIVGFYDLVDAPVLPTPSVGMQAARTTLETWFLAHQ